MTLDIHPGYLNIRPNFRQSIKGMDIGLDPKHESTGESNP